ncbi:MAG: hypothetical protein NT159_24945 [Proteobacteria bacterium]|jgi:hypothetical protein|nr:hypothetical protein [Pseudomonadota bacterium]
MTSKFKHTAANKSAPDPAALAAFAAGAETRSTVLPLVRNDGMTEPKEEAIPAKKLTVLLDRERWLQLKSRCAAEDRSAQKIFVAALDQYFGKSST